MRINFNPRAGELGQAAGGALGPEDMLAFCLQRIILVEGAEELVPPRLCFIQKGPLRDCLGK